jgi:hypothetical protein
MNFIDKVSNKVKDKVKRHQERQSSSGVDLVMADRIHLLPAKPWQRLTQAKSLFMSQEYLSVIERFPPTNIQMRYAMAFDGDKPLVAVVCQIAEINGANLSRPELRLHKKLAQNYQERILVCGNLMSSGLHGVAMADSLDEAAGWRIVAEILYKIRRAEQLDGAIDFAMLKDFKGDEYTHSALLERYSYRKICTDPDMQLTLNQSVKHFDDYLAMLTTKYRSRVKKVRRTVEDAGFECQLLTLDATLEKQLHSLYQQVENRAKIRLASLPVGYFSALAESLADRWRCYGIVKDQQVAGFITIVKEGETALAYYVGIDYQINAEVPVYFRLLQAVIEGAIEMGCHKISFGRTASEPKASLGAMPVDTFVWARHRVPLVNLLVRNLFGAIPHENAPSRNAFKPLGKTASS